MSTYSVANAKAGLPRLIDLALAGEEVVITRHGKPVAELKAISAREAAPTPESRAAWMDWLHTRRLKLDRPGPTSVELLNLIYDDPDS